MAPTAPARSPAAVLVEPRTDNSQQHADASANGGTASGGNGGATAAMNTGAATANGGTANGGTAMAAGGPATSGAATMGNFATVGQSSSQTMSA